MLLHGADQPRGLRVPEEAGVPVELPPRLGDRGQVGRVQAGHDGPDGQRFTLEVPWSLLFLDDERVIHESTPIQPVDATGHRDTLVLTFRSGGFQGDDEVG